MSARGGQVIEVIVLRGGGRDELDPMRRVTQFWSFNGDLLAEHDPCRDDADMSRQPVTLDGEAAKP